MDLEYVGFGNIPNLAYPTCHSKIRSSRIWIAHLLDTLPSIRVIHRKRSHLVTQRVFSCGRVVLDDFSPAFVIARNVRFAEQKKFQILFPDPTKCYFGFWKKHLQRFGKRIWNYYVAHDRSTVCFMYFQILRVRISKSKFYYGNPLRPV